MAANSEQIPYSLRLLRLNEQADNKNEASQQLITKLKPVTGYSAPVFIGHPSVFILPPNATDRAEMTSNAWDLLVLVPADSNIVADMAKDQSIAETFEVRTSISGAALTALYEHLSGKGKSSSSTLLPPLPEIWQHQTVPRNSAIFTDTTNTYDYSTNFSPNLHSPNGSAANDGCDRSDTIPFPSALADWVEQYSSTFGHTRSLSMLNLFMYNPNDGRQKTTRYFEEFERVSGSRNGTRVLVTGDCHYSRTPESTTFGADSVADATAAVDKTRNAWDRWGLVEYASIWHFAEMLANKEVQELQRTIKKGGLLDHCVLSIGELQVL